jgi:hypothetical protein
MNDQKKLHRLVSVAFLTAGLFLSLPAHADGPFQYYTVSPCRVVDTRSADGPALQDGAIREFPIQGSCGVPVGAKAVVLNVTAVSPTGAGHLRLFPSGIAMPTVSTVNFVAGDTAIANGAIVPLANQSLEPDDLSVFARVVGPGTVHLLLDVNGYFQ